MKKLCEIAEQRNLSRVISLVTRSNINNNNCLNIDSKKIFLHQAARYGHTKVIEKLLKEGANVSYRDTLGQTPLHLVAYYGHVQIVEKLIEQGAYIHFKDSFGLTPLHKAASSGHVRIVEKLIEKGSDVHSKDFFSTTPLHLATIVGHVQIVENLLEKGADVNSKDKIGKSSIAIAIEREHMDALVLLKRAQQTKLLDAAKKGDLDEVKAYVDNEADNDKGTTPLHAAVKYGKLKVIEFLVGRNASMNVGDEERV